MPKNSPHSLSLLLASKSPRRRQILEALKIPFSVVAPDDVELQPEAKDLNEVALANARTKAKSILSGKEGFSPIVVGADTLVLASGSVLGKPSQKEEAQSYLAKLSGTTHSVITALVLFSNRYGSRESLCRTQVTFRSLSQSEINAYCETSEPYDKAGAYAVQGLGARFIERIEGSYSNVMGLPIETLLENLEALTQTSIYEWF